MSSVHYNSQVWPSHFQIGLIIKLVLFNHIQSEQLIFRCGILAMTSIYVFHLQQIHGSRYHAPVECPYTSGAPVSRGRIQQDWGHWGIFLYYSSTEDNTVKV